MKASNLSFGDTKPYYGKKVLALILTILIAVSSLGICSITASAASVTYDGTNGFYIDISGCSWATDASCVPAVKFYTTGDSSADSTNYVDCVLISSGVYKCFPAAGTYGNMSIARHNAVNYYNDMHDIPLGGSDKNEYVVNSSFNGGSWSNYIEAPTDPPTPKDASTGSSITNGVNNGSLIAVKGQFFDYYTDTEFISGWRTASFSESHGDWEPYHYFDTAIKKLSGNSSTTNWKYPLYLGNFWHKADGYVGAIDANYNNTGAPTGNYLGNFNNCVNNSAGLGSGTPNYAVSAINLTENNLTDNMLKMKGSADESASMSFNAPYFDSDWLLNGTANGSSRALATVVNTQFPIRVTEKNGDPYYEFCSYDFSTSTAKDNLYFTGYDTGNLVAEYGSGSNYQVIDALDYYGGGTNSQHPGFFPFDNNSNQGGRFDNKATDFGFGMRLDIDFNLAMNGKTSNNNDITFNFEGDDDVWVYIDGKLCLDLGGDHKNAKGSINFANLTSTLETGSKDVWTGGTEVTSSQTKSLTSVLGADFNKDNVTTHTITLFYMERGMSESNLKFGFAMSPVGNKFTAEKEVNTANVNSGLKTAVAAADTFTLTHKTSTTQSNYTTTEAAGKEYTYNSGGTSSTNNVTSSGTYTVQDASSAVFTDQFTTGNYFDIVETAPNAKIRYTTTWTATDEKTGASLGSGSTTESAFRFKTTSEAVTDSTQVKLKYVNTPTVQPVTITKSLVDYEDNAITEDTEFGATVYVSLDGTNFSTYPIQYTAGGNTFTTGADGKLVTGGKLKTGRTITIAGVPVGATVKVVEDSTTGYSCLDTDRTVQSTVSTTGAALTVHNKKDAPQQASAVLTATKLLDGNVPTSGQFTFRLYASDHTTLLQTKSNVDGDITFDSMSYSTTGTYWYYMQEVKGTAAIKYDTTVYKVRVEVTQEGSSLVADVTYYRVVSSSLTPSSRANTPPIFRNTSYKVNVTLNKKDSSNNPISGCKFKLVAAKSDGNGGYIEDTSTDAFKLENIESDANGVASFSNVPCGYYLVYETETVTGYELNGSPIVLKLLEGQSGVVRDDTLQIFTYSTSMTDDSAPSLPKTGGAGVTIFVIAGVVFIGAAVFIIVKSKKKKEDTKNKQN